MSKEVLISIRPEWVEKIAGGQKTVEVRRTRPKLEPPFKCYIYCTNTRPFLVWGDVFRGDWFTEFTRLSGYGRSDADRIWDVFNGHVAGEFVCDRVKNIMAEQFVIKEDAEKALEGSLLTINQAKNYAKWKNGTPHYECKDLYGWHISDLKIYDQPKPLSAFKGPCKIKVGCWECPYYNYTTVECDGWTIKRPPQSWCYVEELQ